MGRLATWRIPIYAIVRAGGKQYRVEPHQLLDVERIKADVGSKVDLRVLLVGGNGDVSIGSPEVANAKVVAEIIEHGRGDKILVFKYKNKTRYRRKQGHRQDYTRLQIQEIVTSGGTFTDAPERPKSTAPKRVRKPKAEPVEIEAVAAEPTAEVAEAEAPAAEAPEAEAPKARRARKPATTEKPARPRRGPKAKATTEADKPALEPETEAPAPEEATDEAEE
ncbi:MAG: 50S ribosomal protein L21 [Dehalococcoidia bacterium]